MSRLQRVRVRSLRRSALLVVLAVVASPLVLLFTTNAIESLFVGRTRERAVVEAHGGTIDAHSPPDGGARFVVRLPFTRS